MKPFCLLLLLCAINPAFSQVNLTNGLVAYYPFNGDANDHSGNNNNPSFNNATPVAGQSGVPNTAYYFNGQNSYIQVPNSPTINFGNQFSFFCLIKPMGFYEGTCHGNNILEKGQDNGVGTYLIRYDDAGAENSQNCFTAQADTLHENLWAMYSGVKYQAPFVEENKWYALACVSDGVTVSFYLNCQLISSAPMPPGITLTNGADLTIGCLAPPDLPFWFNGIIDEIRMYNRPLNIQEINTLSGCPVSTCAPDFTDFNFVQSACNGQSVHFSAAFPDSIASAQWDLGDGTTGNTNAVTHVYAAAGNYPVKLVVQYNGGCKDSITKDIPFMMPIVDTTVVLTRDTTICAGQQLMLRAETNQPGYCWSPLATLSDPSLENPIATPAATTTYFCTSTVLGNNLVYNGDFSKGDVGFTSDYFSITPETGTAEYTIGATPSTWSGVLGNCADHTSGSGNMMMVSGFTGVANIWSQKVALQPNTNYLFSGWIQSLSATNPATLSFSINGAVMGSILAPAGTCTWSPFNIVWNSGDSTNALLSLVSQGDINGSFFALDDISFAPFHTGYDSVNVTLIAYPTLKVHADTTICGPYTVPLSATGASGYSWSPGATLSDSTVADPLASTTATTSYIVTAFNDPACSARDTEKVTVLPVPVFGLTPAGASEVCQGTSFTLTAQGGDTYQWASTLQGPGLSLQNTLTTTGILTDTFAVAIYDSACLVSDTLYSVVTVDTIPVLSLSASNSINCSEGQATLMVSGGNGYTWTPASTLSNALSAAPVASPSVTTWYTVTTTSGACSTSDSIELSVDYGGQVSTFAVPNAFTPNGDGINDCFRVQYWGVVKSFELSVFDRWGNKVFYTQNPSDCWDGTFHGIAQPSGGYVYQIKAASPCAASGVIFRKGVVALMR